MCILSHVFSPQFQDSGTLPPREIEITPKLINIRCVLHLLVSLIYLFYFLFLAVPFDLFSESLGLLLIVPRHLEDPQRQGIRLALGLTA
jgi:hypothetical protein